MFKKNRSFVWDYFTKNPNAIDSATCRICKKSYKRGNSTSNLIDHLKRDHMTILERDGIFSVHQTHQRASTNELPNNNVSVTTELSGQPVESVSVSDQRTVTNETIVTSKRLSQSELPSKRQKQLTLLNRFGAPSDQQVQYFTTAIVKMIAEDLQPVSIVENTGFRNLVQLLDSRYKIPNRRTLTRSIIPNLYEETRTKVHSLLAQSKYVSITTDIWTSINTDSFITITAHFVQGDRLNTVVLCTKKLLNNHTGENLAEVLLTEFNKWDIQSKIAGIVTDGGSNIKAAVRLMNLPHIPCTAHKLNLIVSQALMTNIDYDDQVSFEDNDADQIKFLLKKCRSIVGFFKRSEVGNRHLVEKQKQLGMTNTLKLKQDVRTRWNSTLVMLERLFKLKEPVTIVLMSLRDGQSNLTPSQWDVVEDIIPLLQPFDKMTVELSYEKAPTISKVIPLVRGLQNTLSKKNPRTSQGKFLREQLLNNVRNRFQSLEKLLPIPYYANAAFLDPRSKKACFTNQQNANDAEASIISEIVGLVQNQTTVLDEAVDEAEVNESESEESLWSFLTEKVNSIQSQTTNRSNAIILVKQYLGMPYQNLSCNLIQYWQHHKDVLSPLSDIALKYATIPATSVPSERIFSKTGQIMSERRNRLLPDNLDKLIFLNKNMNIE
ncbi:unnamed protein product [Macrosiphum euphorbiae]|uniref:BED-type domain-containing protein n=1 Tax=Macrosiphum euphorbiae TaxID=13131 RepID=A0AAV0VFE5_9HEMI|nr:unnamed protein product [Macrosiphum euphorbiae]